MDTEIKFLSQTSIDIDYTKKVIEELSIENNWILEMQVRPSFFYEKNGSFEFSITTEDGDFLFAKIINKSFKEEWLLMENEENPKKHLGEICFYILSVINFKSKNDSIEFLLTFSIKLLEKIPSVMAETLESNTKTMFEEYTLADLRKVMSSNSSNNWRMIKIQSDSNNN